MSDRANFRVVHITTVHIPFDIRIFHKECRSLAEAGYPVTLIACHTADEERDGVRVRALPSTGGRLSRMLRLPWRAWRAAKREGPAVFHIHDPELIPLGVVLRIGGQRVVYDAHEDLPAQIANKGWIPRPLRALAALVARVLQPIALRLFDRVVVATPAIGRSFGRLDTVLVQNFPVLSEFDGVARTPYADRPRNLTYVGAFTEIRGGREMVALMERLGERMGARLLVGGPFQDAAFEAEARSAPGAAAIEFRGRLDRVGVVRMFSESRVGLVLFQPVPNHVESQPNKLYEYMAAGLPVIASNFPLWEEFIATAGAGLTVDPRDANQMAEAAAWLLEHTEEAEAMGRRGRAACVARYNWGAEAEKLIAMYDGLTGRAGP